MRILICGVSGMIGHTFWRVLSARHQDVHGTLHGSHAATPRRELFARQTIENFEAADFDQVSRTLDDLKPQVIVNCIGITKRKPEANDVSKAFVVNSRFPHHLARWAARNHARVIHYSTDCVFDGSEGNYRERSVTTAPDVYGQTKFFGEIDYEHCLTIRTSMIGREIAGFTELLEWFIAQKGKKINGFRNALYSGMTTLAMAGLLDRIIHDFPALNGRYQIAGPVISKFELLRQLQAAYGLELEIAPNDAFHCDRSLRSEKFQSATGLSTPSWPEMIAQLVQDSPFYSPSASALRS